LSGASVKLLGLYSRTQSSVCGIHSHLKFD
jgi:hypothetical protein